MRYKQRDPFHERFNMTGNAFKVFKVVERVRTPRSTGEFGLEKAAIYRAYTGV